MTELVPRPRTERFALVRRLGRGGTADAWLARRAGGLFSEEVYTKRSHRKLDRDDRRSLLEEARLLSRIRHVNVVQLLEGSEDEDGEVFLVLELVRGADLHTLSRAARAPRPIAAPRGGRSDRHVLVSRVGRRATCSARAASSTAT